jgi:hypothetical protein
MGSFYRLLIQCEKDERIKIDEILGVSKSNVEIGWELIIEENSLLFNQALSYFTELLENNFDSLRSAGISSEMITVWYMYEYEQQCNMEFHPEIMKKLGDLQIVLCISCWEK